MARVFDRTDEEVNHSLQELKTSMEATVAATCASSCGTNDRAKHERSYLERALKILTEMKVRKRMDLLACVKGTGKLLERALCGGRGRS